MTQDGSSGSDGRWVSLTSAYQQSMQVVNGVILPMNLVLTILRAEKWMLLVRINKLSSCWRSGGWWHYCRGWSRTLCFAVVAAVVFTVDVFFSSQWRKPCLQSMGLGQALDFDMTPLLRHLLRMFVGGCLYPNWARSLWLEGLLSRCTSPRSSWKSGFNEYTAGDNIKIVFFWLGVEGRDFFWLNSWLGLLRLLRICVVKLSTMDNLWGLLWGAILCCLS